MVPRGLIHALYTWLPIIFGCHCKPERSFFIRGVQFPLCARCTGMLGGMTLFLATAWFYLPTVPLLAAFLIPLICDGTIQQKTSYESTNLRRLITGLLFGYAFMGLARAYLLSGFWTGYRFGKEHLGL